MGIMNLTPDSFSDGGRFVDVEVATAHAMGQVAAGADIIALDCTPRPRPDGVTMEELVRRIKEEFKLPVMADIATLEEAVAAEKAGVERDVIVTGHRAPIHL